MIPTEEAKMNLENLAVKPLGRVSPSRYTAMKTCLLREVWASSGNEPLLPPSPLAKLGGVIHCLLEVVGRGQLHGNLNEQIIFKWDDLISEAEKEMARSAQTQHLVPMIRSIPDFEVRKLRACRRAEEIATAATHARKVQSNSSSRNTGFEVWVESDDRQVGGFIDRVASTKDGVVLTDYKSGKILEHDAEEGVGKLKSAYEAQLQLYAALYHQRFGAWPIRLEVLPLQGAAVEVPFNPEDAHRLLAEASAFMRSSNKLLGSLRSRHVSVVELASPRPPHCRFCLFRPACRAYWNARNEAPEEKWPIDLGGHVLQSKRLRNGKLCLIIGEAGSVKSSSFTIRDLTNCARRHPILPSVTIGSRLAVYGLKHDYRSNDYTETRSTAIYLMD